MAEKSKETQCDKKSTEKENNTDGRSSLLGEIEPHSQDFLETVTAAVLRDDLQSALDNIFNLAENEIPDEHAESYLVLAQNICAALDYAEGWILFKKSWAQFLIEQNRVSEARKVIIELAELLPGDEAVAGLQKEMANLSEGANAHSNGCDIEFYKLLDHLEKNTADVIFADVIAGAEYYKSNDPTYFAMLKRGLGSFEVNDRLFLNYFGSRYNYLRENIDGLIWLYENLENYRSKYQFKTVLQFWLTLKPKMGEHGIEKTFAHYFDLDIIKCDENEVYVDCGVYVGDTILSYIAQYGGQYKSIYGYELAPSTYEKARSNLKDFERVYLRNAGVSDKNGTMTFIDSIGAGNRLLPGGNVVGNIVRIDDDIKEDITLIKMDVEGAEIAALRGAQNHIIRSKPKLAISLYHKVPDLLDVPKLIRQFVPEYKFYFQHSPGKVPYPEEYVLLAVVE